MSVCVCVRSGFNFPCVHCFSVICTEFQMPLYCFCMLAQRALVKCLLPLESTHPLINVLPVSSCSGALWAFLFDMLSIQSISHCQASPLTSVQLSTSFFNYSHQSWTQYCLGDHSSECFLLSMCLLPCPRRPQHHSRNLCSAILQDPKISFRNTVFPVSHPETTAYTFPYFTELCTPDINTLI